MTFASRQFEELYQYIEVSFTAAVSPGAITNGITNAVAVNAVACTVGNSTVASQITLGDILEVVAPASAALNGVIVLASPTATVGQIDLLFINTTGGSVTPVASSIYKIIARRVTNNLVV